MIPNIPKNFKRSFQFLSKVSSPSPLHTVSLLGESFVENKPLLERMLRSSSEIICADGGANHYYDFCLRNPVATPPKVILGDMDAILPKSSDFFTGKHTEILKDENQEFNDFEKAIRFIIANNLKNNPEGIRLLCNNDFGRMDHFM